MFCRISHAMWGKIFEEKKNLSILSSILQKGSPFWSIYYIYQQSIHYLQGYFFINFSVTITNLHQQYLHTTAASPTDAHHKASLLIFLNQLPSHLPMRCWRRVLRTPWKDRKLHKSILTEHHLISTKKNSYLS